MGGLPVQSKESKESRTVQAGQASRPCSVAPNTEINYRDACTLQIESFSSVSARLGLLDSLIILFPGFSLRQSILLSFFPARQDTAQDSLPSLIEMLAKIVPPES